MSRFSTSSLCFAVPMVFLSQAALADLTPAQVWGDWQQYMEGMGYSVQGQQSASGNNLTVSDIQLGFEMPDQAGSMNMSMGTIVFVGQGDGSVAVVMPETLPMVMTGTDGTSSSAFKLTMDYIQNGHSMIVSGTPEQMNYAYTADTFGLKLQQLEADGEVIGPETARFDVTGTGLVSNTNMTIGDLRDYQQTGSVGGISYDLFVDNPQEGNQVSLNGNLQNLEMSAEGAIPLLPEKASDTSAMIKAGFEITGAFNAGSSATAMQVTDPVNGDMSLNTSSQGSRLSVDLGADGVSYGGGQTNLQVTMNVADLPFPIELSMAQSAFNLAIPVSKSDEQQDFAFGLTMGDFQMSDLIWGIFDPAGQLPRDPATLVIDLAGKAKLLVDYLDPKVAENMGADVPGEVEAVTINKLLLDAVGAKFEADGKVALDNTDKTTIPGFPKPVGSISFTLDGANGLIDKLVSMGLIPADQAMMPRMMMGMITVPAGGPDQLKSKIDFTTDGQILANGQRIK
ncbi:hypothetical protein JQT66_01845 [Sulfitobacter mediterraneus]|uniref:hypothetical protein n=1 Tax=Sulfitobacter mediterraneus TaxID=83219 RepID=UPI0019333F97|nr:hypothetical protein [Sulfitobacter mediterraneus]MBM1308905.1 hypothetical protein [Sulfitobacter mediterraneus]MBM1312790.1 hypothetical protein [Sulfitobacter mediterraneus]MBM1321172.1 hypothetical protein [Sulfitobacter mediterraneus]MBM1325059.1 hypothetical protein [Sulfitobacter mediterraneus]MBM1396406.1 hypothetical protein [Sulfitobacter mediterraneus]